VNLKALAVHARMNAALVLALLLAGVLLGGLSAALTGTQYKASTRLLISPNAPLISTEPGAGVSSAADAATYTQQRALTYAEIVTTPAILLPAQRELGSVFPGGGLGQRIVVSVVPSTSLIDITVTATTATVAARAANAVARSLAREVASAEQIGTTGAAAVKVVAVSPATPPRSPSSPQPLHTLVIGAIVGLLIGVIVAACRALFDSSIMVGEVLAEVTGAPHLANVAADRRLSGRRLAVNEAPTSPAADDFRVLRAGLQFTDLDEPPHSIVVTGATKAAGTTTVACNLALAFAKVGRRTVLVDGDLRDMAASKAFGIGDRPGLGEVLEGLDLTEALYADQASRLRVLPAGRSQRAAGDALGGNRLSEVLLQLEKGSDIVIVDSPAASYPEARSLAAVAHGTVVVIRHAHTTAQQLEQMLHGLRSVHGRVLGTVLSRIVGLRRR
jgi:Mrp family chromosome partitioning ATPase/capsular polysaccharide biosynthesis protein